MHKAFFILFFTSIGTTTVQSQSNKPNAAKITAKPKVVDFKKKGKAYFWLPALNDSTGNLQMLKIRPVSKDSLNPGSIISFLNEADLGNNTSHKIRLDLIKISNDTIYLKISDSFFLIQSIGTTGAMLYLAGVT